MKVIFVDDDSQDGSKRWPAQLAGKLPVRMIVRHDEKGLSTAVFARISEARGDFGGGDGCRSVAPAERIRTCWRCWNIIKKISFVGSRYVAGGSLDPSWTWFRLLNSKVATWLALPLARIHDPMSGFFAFRRADMPEAHLLSPTVTRSVWNCW